MNLKNILIILSLAVILISSYLIINGKFAGIGNIEFPFKESVVITNETKSLINKHNNAKEEHETLNKNLEMLKSELKEKNSGSACKDYLATVNSAVKSIIDLHTKPTYYPYYEITLANISALFPEIFVFPPEPESLASKDALLLDFMKELFTSLGNPLIDQQTANLSKLYDDIKKKISGETQFERTTSFIKQMPGFYKSYFSILDNKQISAWGKVNYFEPLIEFAKATPILSLSVIESKGMENEKSYGALESLSVNSIFESKIIAKCCKYFKNIHFDDLLEWPNLRERRDYTDLNKLLITEMFKTFLDEHYNDLKVNEQIKDIAEEFAKRLRESSVIEDPANSPWIREDLNKRLSRMAKILELECELRNKIIPLLCDESKLFLKSQPAIILEFFVSKSWAH